MPAPDPVITYGNAGTSGSLENEADLLVENLVFTPTREMKEYKGGSRSTNGIELVDPKLKMEFQTRPTGYSGAGNLADAHPGTQVTSLANFGATRFGFDPTVGTLVFMDPSLTLSTDNVDQFKFAVTHFPFVV